MAPEPPKNGEMADDRKRQVATECWKRGTEAMLKSNWDYSIKMFRQSVTLVPDNLTFRQSLRGCEERQYNNNGKGGAMFGMRSMGYRAQMKKAKFQKKWTEVERIAEEGLAMNPWDAQFNGDLGEALREQGFLEVAVYSYERAVKQDPKSKEFNDSLGKLLEERGEFDRAMECYKRIMQIDPYDPDASARIRAIQAKSVIERGGYEHAKDTRFGMADHEVAKILKGNKDADGPGASVEADLLRAIRKEPANRDNYLRIVDYYRREGNLAEAEAKLKTALEVSGGDVHIREQLEDVQLERQRQVIGHAKEAANNDPGKPELKQRYKDLSSELLRREIEIFSARSERYPTDMRLKFDLGKRYYSDKKHQLAIPLLQSARTDARLKGEAFVLLGKCFVEDKNYSLARRQFEQAKPDIKFDEKPELYTELHYFLGRVCEKMGDVESAIGSYQEVLAVNYGYQDTHKRLQALESGEKLTPENETAS